MPDLSFLLGAGFSKPAGSPLASEINDRLVGLKESDFTIHSDGSAWFRDGEPNPDDWLMRKEERVFVERLLRYYCRAVATPDSFHYETFYDWYKDLREGRTEETGVEAIARGIGRGVASLLLDFDHTFNQLLAGLVTRHHPEVHLGRGLPRSHARFLDLVEYLSGEHRLHFHSLNHDLFFESLSSTDAMQGELADGFGERVSPHLGAQRSEAGAQGVFEGVRRHSVEVGQGHWGSRAVGRETSVCRSERCGATGGAFRRCIIR